MADTQLKTRILLRNDTATAWSTANPVLMKGEIGIETDTNKFKIGDGIKSWSALSYVGTQVEVTGEGEVITGASVSANGTLTLTAKTTLYIYSGGQPTAVKVGGFNGGGTGYSSGYGGGGASDIRIAKDSLYARVIVAGGGGGAYNGSSLKGAGGGT